MPSFLGIQHARWMAGSPKTAAERGFEKQGKCWGGHDLAQVCDQFKTLRDNALKMHFNRKNLAGKARNEFACVYTEISGVFFLF